jgi:hypothetical protein
MAYVAETVYTLPTDDSPINSDEKNIMNAVFKEQQSTVRKFLDGSKDIILAGIIFFLVSIPPVDDFIRKMIPSTNDSVYTLLLVKCLAFMVLYFLLKNLYLARKE